MTFRRSWLSISLLFVICILPFGAVGAEGEEGPSNTNEVLAEEEMSNVDWKNYESWLTQFFTSAESKLYSVSGRGSDPDGDGLNNYFEFIAKLDPTDGADRFKLELMDVARPQLSYGPIKEDVEYELWYSSDLRNWTYADFSYPHFEGDRIVIEAENTGESRYFRVELYREVDPVDLAGFVPIPAGSFSMGSPVNEPGREEEEVLHTVEISQGFLMGETEVTWSQWNDTRDEAVLRGYTDISVGFNGYNGDSSGDHPVTGMNWFDTIKWCNLRSELEGRTPVYYTSPEFGAETVYKQGMDTVYVDGLANGYRLPTEAEWEYVCRSGTSTPFFNGAIVDELSELEPYLDQVGWYSGNSPNGTSVVGQKLANGLGLHDMHGNVWEFCWDAYGPYSGDAIDPSGEGNSEFYRLARGGGWSSPLEDCRSAHRVRATARRANSSVGFRIVYRDVPWR